MIYRKAQFFALAACLFLLTQCVWFAPQSSNLAGPNRGGQNEGGSQPPICVGDPCGLLQVYSSITATAWQLVTTSDPTFGALNTSDTLTYVFHNDGTGTIFQATNNSLGMTTYATFRYTQTTDGNGTGTLVLDLQIGTGSSVSHSSQAYHYQLGYDALWGPDLILINTANGYQYKFTAVPPPPGPLNLQRLGYIQYHGETTNAMQMVFNGVNLLVSGAPFGLMELDNAAQGAPTLAFALSEQLGVDSASSATLPSWGVATYASGALAASGSLVYTSGDYGMSIFDISNPNQVREMRRYSPPDPNSLEPHPNPLFEFTALVVNTPTEFLYGFRQKDYVHIMRMSGSGLDIASESEMSYPTTNDGNAKVSGAAIFYGQVFVAFTDQLVSMDLGDDGSLNNIQHFSQYQAVDVQATANHLYVHHRATASGPASAVNPTGIYVFNPTGQFIGYFAIDPIRFAVSPDESKLYANEDGAGITEYGISLP